MANLVDAVLTRGVGLDDLTGAPRGKSLPGKLATGKPELERF
jgi:hypothetical protein